MKLNRSTRKLMGELIVTRLHQYKFLICDRESFLRTQDDFFFVWTDGKQIFTQDKWIPVSQLSRQDPVVLEKYVQETFPGHTLYDWYIVRKLNKAKLNRNHPWVKELRG